MYKSILSSNVNLKVGPMALKNGISHYWDQRPFTQILLSMVFDWGLMKNVFIIIN